MSVDHVQGTDRTSLALVSGWCKAMLQDLRGDCVLAGPQLTGSSVPLMFRS